MINPTAHADAILSWLENEIGTVSRDELRKRIEDEVRDVARRAYQQAAQVASNQFRGAVLATQGNGEWARCALAIEKGILDLESK